MPTRLTTLGLNQFGINLLIKNMKKGKLFGMAIAHIKAVKSAKFFGDEETEEQKKAKAMEAVKKTAEDAVTAKLPDLLKSNLGSEETKSAIEAIVKGVFDTAKIKDPVDNAEKTIAEIVKEMQTQHDALAVMVKAFEKGNSATKGSFVEFVEKNIAENGGKVFNDKENVGIGANKNYSATKTIKASELLMEFKAPALMTTANVTPNVAGGFSPLFGNYIDTEIGHTPKPDNIMLQLVTVKNQPGTESIWYSARVNEEGDAQFIAEGALKPLADAEWATYKAAIFEVAVRWKFTKRLMNHAPAVVSDFLEHANQLVDQKIDDNILFQVADSTHFAGIAQQAGAFVVPAQLAEYYAQANIWDVINAMATRIRLSNFKGQLTAVLNTVWEAKMMGIKDLEGRYITPPFVTPDGKKVGSVNIVFSNKIDDDAILIGELKRYNVVFAENVQYDEGYENDDFSKNLVSRKLEAFLGAYINPAAAGSILYDDISSVLTDIGQPVI